MYIAGFMRLDLHIGCTPGLVHAAVLAVGLLTRRAASQRCKVLSMSVASDVRTHTAHSACFIRGPCFIALQQNMQRVKCTCHNQQATNECYCAAPTVAVGGQRPWRAFPLPTTFHCSLGTVKKPLSV